MIKNILFYLSFLLFITFLVLFALEIAGRSDILSVSAHTYLNFLKNGSLFIISAVLVLISFGAARIVVYGLFRTTLPNKEKLKTQLFLFSFAFFIVCQFVSVILMRTSGIDTP